MTKIWVDDKEIEALTGASLLQTCLDNGIYIPHLCYIKGASEPFAGCRLCFVEIEGMKGPVTSCTVTAAEGMVVRTNTPQVRELQQTALRLLLSVHDARCKECEANKKCELQRLAKFLNVRLKPRRFSHYLKEPGVDETHPCLTYYPNRCVLCGRCIQVCRDGRGQPMLSFAKRGFDTMISFHEVTPPGIPGECRACAAVCPVGALVPKQGAAI